MNIARPEDLGLSSVRLQRLNRAMQRHVEKEAVAGALAVVARRSEVCHFERFGMMDREASRSMQNDTIFRIYSMSKPIASVAAMMLYEEGFFQLDDPIYAFVPELRGQKVFVGLDNGHVQLTDRDSDVTFASYSPTRLAWAMALLRTRLSRGCTTRPTCSILTAHLKRWCRSWLGFR